MGEAGDAGGNSGEVRGRAASRHGVADGAAGPDFAFGAALHGSGRCGGNVLEFHHAGADQQHAVGKSDRDTAGESAGVSSCQRDSGPFACGAAAGEFAGFGLFGHGRDLRRRELRAGRTFSFVETGQQSGGGAGRHGVACGPRHGPDPQRPLEADGKRGDGQSGDRGVLHGQAAEPFPDADPTGARPGAGHSAGGDGLPGDRRISRADGPQRPGGLPARALPGEDDRRLRDAAGRVEEVADPHSRLGLELAGRVPVQESGADPEGLGGDDADALRQFDGERAQSE